MKLYKFDEKTGELIGEFPAYFSSLDQKYVLTYDSTFQVPPTVTTNQRAVFLDIDGKVPQIESLGSWKVVPDFRGQEYWMPDGSKHVMTELGKAPPKGSSMREVKTLEQLKAEKHIEIKTNRNRMEFGTFKWNDHEFDCDSISQQRLTIAMFSAQNSIMNGIDATIDWRLADNSLVSLSPSDIIQVYTAMGENTRLAHEHAAQLRYLVDTATKPSEIEAIVW